MTIAGVCQTMSCPSVCILQLSGLPNTWYLAGIGSNQLNHYMGQYILISTKIACQHLHQWNQMQTRSQQLATDKLLLSGGGICRSVSVLISGRPDVKYSSLRPLSFLLNIRPRELRIPFFLPLEPMPICGDCGNCCWWCPRCSESWLEWLLLWGLVILCELSNDLTTRLIVSVTLNNYCKGYWEHC